VRRDEIALLTIPHFRYSVAAVPITSIALLAKKSNLNVGLKNSPRLPGILAASTGLPRPTSA
jgi:hypothetical protein